MRYRSVLRVTFRKTRITHEFRSEAVETEARRGFSQVRPTQAYSWSPLRRPSEKSAAGREDRAT